MLARLVEIVVGVIALIIGLGIVLFVLGANPSNTVVSHIHSWARWLAGPFDGMFHLRHAKAALALNWGIALVVWLVIGSIIARIVRAPAWSLRRRVPA